MKVRAKKDFHMRSGEIAFCAGAEYDVLNAHKCSISYFKSGMILIDEQGEPHLMPYEDENKEYFEILEEDPNNDATYTNHNNE